MQVIRNKYMNIKFITTVMLVVVLSVFQSCSINDDNSTMISPELMFLEKKYNVQISSLGQREYLQSDIEEIEQEIVKLRNVVFSNKETAVFAKCNKDRRFKIPGAETLNPISLSSWAFNLTWFNVILSPSSNGGGLDISSSISGVSIYSYKQSSTWTDFTQGSTSANFKVYGDFYVTIAKYLMNISLPGHGEGSANFATGTGTLKFYEN